MQKFFWAMHYELAGRLTYSVKLRTVGNNARNRALSDEAAYYKAMALKPVGSILKVPERRFIGEHPQVDKIVSVVVDNTMKDVEQYIKNLLKP